MKVLNVPAVIGPNERLETAPESHVRVVDDSRHVALDVTLL
jgi:hypothetical protein